MQIFETQPQIVLKLFLIFHRFQPRCSYKHCSYKKNQCMSKFEESGQIILSLNVSKNYFSQVYGHKFDQNTLRHEINAA